MPSMNGGWQYPFFLIHSRLGGANETIREKTMSESLKKQKCTMSIFCGFLFKLEIVKHVLRTAMKDIIDSAYVNVVFFLICFPKNSKGSHKTKSHFKELFLFFFF